MEPAVGAGGTPEMSTSEAAPPLIAFRRTRRALWTAVAVGVVFAAFVAVLATRPSASTRLARSPLLGKPVPPIEGEALDAGQFNLSGLTGRWVLVNFFATWCVPCRLEHPELVRFAARHRALGDAEVVGVIYDDSSAAVRAFRAKEGGDWPMVADPKGRIALDFGVAGVPESYLISPDGVVTAKVVGGVREADLDRLLARAMQGA
jgi:cytochrome c biogenesis protein CcmG, thiol:disulfide interchange protein DsbE